MYRPFKHPSNSALDIKPGHNISLIAGYDVYPKLVPVDSESEDADEDSEGESGKFMTI